MAGTTNDICIGLALLFLGCTAANAAAADITAGDAALARKSISAPAKGRTIKFRALGASGLFGKTISVWGRLVGESEDRKFASIRYGGFGQAVSRTDWITIENLSIAYLQMDIDPQFALPGIRLHMRSDDPATSHYLFYRKGQQNWAQVPRGTEIDVFSYAGCGLKEFSWEDGGDFHHQDFFFELDSGPDCILISSNPGSEDAHSGFRWIGASEIRKAGLLTSRQSGEPLLIPAVLP